MKYANQNRNSQGQDLKVGDTVLAKEVHKTRPKTEPLYADDEWIITEINGKILHLYDPIDKKQAVKPMKFYRKIWI